MATTARMHIPDVLRSYELELMEALAAPMLATWDEDETFHEALQPAAIAAVLIESGVHEEIADASIAYVYREKMKTRDRIVWGKASKAGGRLEFFAGYDFVMEINWQQWKGLSDMQRVALVDHELSHFGREENGKGERTWCLVSHDIEEFGGIVKRWGLWRTDLTVFAGAVVHAHQLGLFEGAED
jgi:hypothetical protein